MTDYPPMQAPVCPLPMPHNDYIVMGHGSGGQMTNNLITRTFLPKFGNTILNMGNDAGIIQNIHNPELEAHDLVVSIDCHVVWPLFFPGGDIGRLSICGTVNDVSMLGAIPLYLTAGFILEEGLDFTTLDKVVKSMSMAADEAGILIIAGDTKVVQKGKADGLYITTSGIGFKKHSGQISGSNAQPGDIVIVSGTLGDHGMSVLAARGELGFSADIISDVAPLNHLVSNILTTSNQIHVLRDPTRGGLATTLNEIARQSNVSILLDEQKIPIKPTVADACEILGFDPLYVANEGKLIVVVERMDAQKVLDAMRQTKYGQDSTIIGEVKTGPSGRVLLTTPYGSTRILDTLSGEMLPRIC